MSGESVEVKSRTKVCGGVLYRITHRSIETQTMMTFAVFLPPKLSTFEPNNLTNPSTAKIDDAQKVPYLLYLSGLTCTDENVCQKGMPFRQLSKLQVRGSPFNPHKPLHE